MVEYDLSLEDLVAWAEWRHSSTGADEPQRRRIRVVAAWLVGAASYLLVSVALTIPWLLQHQLPLAGISEALALTVGLAGGWYEWRVGSAARWLERRRARNRARVALERSGSARRIELTEDGLRIVAGQQAATVPWSGITEIIQTQNHLFIRTGPVAAHVVPLTASGAAELARQLQRRLPPLP